MNADLKLQQLIEQLSADTVTTIIEHVRSVRPDHTPDSLATIVADFVEATGASSLVWHPLSAIRQR